MVPQSSATFLPSTDGLHDWLVERAGFYRAWHTHPHCHTVHWAVLILALLVAAVKIAAAVLPLVIPSPVASGFM